jgi:hypothetical protein
MSTAIVIMVDICSIYSPIILLRLAEQHSMGRGRRGTARILKSSIPSWIYPAAESLSTPDILLSRYHIRFKRDDPLSRPQPELSLSMWPQASTSEPRDPST